MNRRVPLITILATVALIGVLRLIPGDGGSSASSTTVRKPGSDVAKAAQPKRRILLIGLDGCSYDLVRKWIGEGKLPHLASLISTGASGHLSTIETPRLPGARPTISSPVVWTTMATGKLPDKHGIWDFGQPFPEEMYAWMDHDAEIVLPTTLRTELIVHLTAKSAPDAGSIRAMVSLNDVGLPPVSLTDQAADVIIRIPESAVSEERNRLGIRIHRGEGRAIGCRMVRVENSNGRFVGAVDPWRNADAFGSGWYLPDTTARPLIQTAHRQVRAFWDILGERGRSVALVGWWGTWPAYPINGVMLSSHLGLRGKKTLTTRSADEVLHNTPHLTYPDDYLKHVFNSGLVPQDSNEELARTIVDLSGCRIEPGSTSAQTLADVFAQDTFYRNLSVDLLSGNADYDLLTVYFEGMDVVGHKFYNFLAGRRSKDNWVACPDAGRLERVVENYYRYVDSMIGELTAKARGQYDTTMIITDHGFDVHGHADTGWVLLSGPGIDKTLIRHASVRDVTPTLLYMLGLPVADDMDGEPILEAFSAGYRDAVARIPTYETRPIHIAPEASEADKELEERFRSLGYIE